MLPLLGASGSHELALVARLARRRGQIHEVRAGCARVPEERKGLTYAASGVDIPAADKAKKALIKALEYKRAPGLGAPIPLAWGYAGLVEFGEHALALTTDGVGTKVEVAAQLNRWETIGIDCVAMNVNDLVCVGAEPLAMVDYLSLIHI